MRSVQLNLFEAVAEEPPWFKISRHTPASQAKNVLHGRHPMGFGLKGTVERIRLAILGVEPSCRTCAHFRRAVWHDRTYFKCAKAGITRGKATDIRARWPACERWEAPVERS